MVDISKIPAAMKDYELDDVSELETFMIEADCDAFCDALHRFDEHKKLENMPYWVAETLYDMLTCEAFEDYESGNDIFPYHLDVSNRQEVEWVIDMILSWGVYENDPNEGIDVTNNHYFVHAGEGYWVEIFRD